MSGGVQEIGRPAVQEPLLDWVTPFLTMKKLVETLSLVSTMVDLTLERNRLKIRYRVARQF